jgi:glyoxylase-like metal-dependent hydrolase (beta-lactamase superfamily II)
MAHTVEGTSHPIADENGVIENDWAIHQMNTTVNFSRDNAILGWYLGGLNYQVEHHLFPKICHVHYPAIAQIVKETAKEYGVPTLIHTIDRKILNDPSRSLSAEGESRKIKAGLGVSKFEEPDVVREVVDGESFQLAGFDIVVQHAPGHTAGSALFTINEEFLVSGDVLFAGAIGRTDLPTGSASDMRNSLISKILPLNDELIVLPGHGPQTTIGRERVNNPYLQEAFLHSKPERGE